MNAGPSPGGTWAGRCREAIRQAWWDFLQAILEFLEVIGLRSPPQQGSHQEQLAEFRRHHDAFRQLLAANDSFLRNIAEFELRLAGQKSCNPSQIEELSLQLLADVEQLICSLNAIARGRHEALYGPFEAVSTAVERVFHPTPSDIADKLVVELTEISQRDAPSVGAKMANLGEIRNRVGLPTPDGFALTATAYRQFIEQGKLGDLTDGANATEQDHRERVEAAVRDLRSGLAERILLTEVPLTLRHAMIDAYDRLTTREHCECAIAVRSSAIGEDEELSFAGQYQTLLNVQRTGLADAWRQVVASLHSAAASHYRQSHGFPQAHATMAVGFVRMVPAIVAGVAYSRDPVRTDRSRVIIQVAAGLGTEVVDGSTIPETIEIVLGDHETSIRRGDAGFELPEYSGYPDELFEDVSMALADRRSLLTDEEAAQLARWARQLESHFGTPQDVEWAMDPERRLFVLQSRPLALLHYTTDERPPLSEAPLLVSSGEIVCPGLATGIAVHFSEDGDFDAVPQGAVLVIKRPSPKFVRLMGKAAAIVADTGSTTGHMASLAREFRVPTLLGTRDGTKRIRAGQEVTVDALGGHVYAGNVTSLLEAGRPAVPPTRDPLDFRTRYLLRRAAELIVPLHLTDPHAPEFRAECCATLHDITRYVHERSYEEMFRIGETLDDCRSAAYYLDVFLPVDLYIIDLGGGVSGSPQGNRIKKEHLSSVPLLALMKGMLHPKIPRWGARPLDLSGFAAVVIQHALTSPEQERTFRDPSYALVSDRYLNYTARVGYHFSIVDAYCGDTANKNYIHLLFRGGAADLLRRSRRARAIAGILREWGFAVEVMGDSTDGRINKMSREETARLIEYVGRLLQFMRQMDVAMTSDAAVEQVKDAFLRGDYALEHLGEKQSQD